LHGPAVSGGSSLWGRPRAETGATPAQLLDSGLQSDAIKQGTKLERLQ
jgi:hypothetical protein